MLDTFKSFVVNHFTVILATYAASLVASIFVRTLASSKFKDFETKHPIIGGLFHMVFGFLANSDQVRAGLVLVARALGWKPPSDGSSGSSSKLPITIIGAAMLLSMGCAQPLTPTSVGAGVLSLAEANRILADACGTASVIVAETKGKPAGQAVLDQCKTNHARVHAALDTFADAVDAWRAGKAGAPSCAAQAVEQTMIDSLTFTRSIGGNVTARVDDAISFIGSITSNLLGTCEVQHG